MAKTIDVESHYMLVMLFYGHPVANIRDTKDVFMIMTNALLRGSGISDQHKWPELLLLLL